MVGPTRWGIASVGLISNDFVIALSTLPSSEHQVVAAAARDLSRAKSFADEHGIAKAYGKYDELAQDPNVEVVYIGTINPEHLKLGKLYLNAGKHVLCEKPLCMNKKEVTELVELAKSKNLFLMEAVWSRFNPVYKKLKDEIDSGKLGEVFLVQTNFGVKLGHKERVTQRALGGSTLLDIGIYCIQFALFVLGKPSSLKATGAKNSEGVDESVQIIFEYPGGKSAVLVASSRVVLSNEARVSGEAGSATVKAPFWVPTEVDINGEIFSITLPQTSKKIRYSNSTALAFEAAEVRRCLEAGLKQSPLVSWDESLVIAEIEDEVRRQIGVTFDQD